MIPVLELVAVALVVAGADQASKRAVVRCLAPGERRPLPGGLALAHVRNARGGLVAVPLAVAVGLVVACSAVAVALAASAPGTAVVVGLGLVVGGASSNVLDRIRLGAVVDVLSVLRWRVVNLADVALVVGALLVGVATWTAPT